jgi:toxin-antitoxin system PIN domain toxin
VILVDTNLLLYAHVSDYPQHETARRWLDERLRGSARVGLPWPSLLGFLRLVTNPRLFPRPESPADAWAQVESWLEADSAWIPTPTERHRQVFASLLPSVTGPNLVPDAHLAALAIEHGLVVQSADGDFARFPGLRWENPVASSGN